MTGHGRAPAVAVLVGLVVTAGACSYTGPLSGSGAMRIDIEVYKGPLAQAPETQWGSLIGYLEEAKRALVENLNFTLAVVANRDLKSLRKDGPPYFKSKGVGGLIDSTASATSDSEKYGQFLYKPEKDQHTDFHTPVDWCDQLDPEGMLDQIDYFDCVILRNLYVDSLDVLREIDDMLTTYVSDVHHDRRYDIHHGHRKWETYHLVEMLTEVAELSSEFRAKAYRWGIASAAGQSLNPKVRMAVVMFVMTVSEYGNQLQSRADALLKQYGEHRPNRDARELPLSTFLRESEPTEFLHLHDWLDASDDAIFPPRFLRWFIPGSPSLDVEGRIKVVERLYADHFWSHINTVHASGRGKVNMVFFKDDIGNWSLKNFENYPGELLDSYIGVAKKALETAAKVAGEGATGGNAAMVGQLLKVANQAVAGKPGTSSSLARSQLRALESGLIASLTQASGKWEEKEKGDKLTAEDLQKNRRAALQEFEGLVLSFQDQVGIIKNALGKSQSTSPSASLGP